MSDTFCRGKKYIYNAEKFLRKFLVSPPRKQRMTGRQNRKRLKFFWQPRKTAAAKRTPPLICRKFRFSKIMSSVVRKKVFSQKIVEGYGINVGEYAVEMRFYATGKS